MRRPVTFALRLLAVALIVMGAIWFLQGKNVLPGGFMEGQIAWVHRGVAAVIAGAVLLFVVRKG